MSHQQLICHVQGSLCGVFCLLLVSSENTRSKTKQNQHKNNVTFKLMFGSFFLQGTTHRSQASSSTHLRLACRLQLRPPNLVILIHRCVQLGLQILMLRGCFEHTFAVAIILCMRTIENGYWSTNTCCGCGCA